VSAGWRAARRRWPCTRASRRCRCTRCSAASRSPSSCTRPPSSCTAAWGCGAARGGPPLRNGPAGAVHCQRAAACAAPHSTAAARPDACRHSAVHTSPQRRRQAALSEETRVQSLSRLLDRWARARWATCSTRSSSRPPSRRASSQVRPPNDTCKLRRGVPRAPRASSSGRAHLAVRAPGRSQLALSACKGLPHAPPRGPASDRSPPPGVMFMSFCRGARALPGPHARSSDRRACPCVLT
jgi:hypothetical protein